MAYSFYHNTEKSIELSEYMEILETQFDMTDRESVLESSEYLKMLSNNRHFLTEILNKEITTSNDFQLFQSDNLYTPITLMIGDGKEFSLRANMWLPQKENTLKDWEKKIFSYQSPHDHSTDFMTVGYIGNGYTTEIYEYEPDKIVGENGESVELTFLEKTSLPVGKVMYYRASQDIHTQIPPQEFSVSVNLLLGFPADGKNDQFWFDTENSKLDKPLLPRAFNSDLFICNLAKHVGDNTTIGLLEDMSKNHYYHRVRAEAFETLAILTGNSEQCWQLCLQDEHKFVKNLGLTKLAELDHQ